MSLFDMFQDPDYSSDQAQVADAVARNYFRYQTIHRGLDALGGMFENGEEKRKRQNDELDLRLKRRALGLPMEDDDYEEATNGGHPMRTFSRSALAAKSAMQQIPEKGFLEPPQPRIAGMLTGYSREHMRGVADTFPKPDMSHRRDFLKLFAPAKPQAPTHRSEPLSVALSGGEDVIHANPLLSTGRHAVPEASVGFRALGTLGSSENGLSRIAKLLLRRGR